MIHQKAADEARKIAMVNYLFCVIDDSTDADDREWYREMDNVEACLKRLCGIVRMRKLVRNTKQAINKLAKQYFYKVIAETAHGIGDYWRNEYGIDSNEIARFLERENGQIISDLIKRIYTIWPVAGSNLPYQLSGISIVNMNFSAQLVLETQ